MKRSNQYEAAFEGYLQWHRLSYIAVDETRRSFLGESSVKNLDFIVLGDNGARLLVDVKGRRFPGGRPERPRHVWENWSAQEDIDCLLRWMEVFGPGYLGMLVFIYQVQPTVTLPDNTADLWTWRGQRYLLRAVPVEAYRQHLRVRSPRWGTVCLPAAVFRSLVLPFSSFVPSHTIPAANLEPSDQDW